MRPALLGALLLFHGVPAVAQNVGGTDAAKGVREEILQDLFASEDKSQDVAGAYHDLFTIIGLAGLPALINDEDTSIALQSAWEVHRKVVKRDPSVLGLPDLVFDRKRMEMFLEIMAKRLKTELPEWWSATLLKGGVFPERHHAFRNIEVPRLPTVTVKVENEDVVITSRDRSVRLPKASWDRDTNVLHRGKSPVVLSEADLTFVARPQFRGYPFELIGMDSVTGKKLWATTVWAARRGFSSGPDGVNPVEIRCTGDLILVFGAESHGMYVEGFHAKTGKCQFRFCTCYWFNHPEAWGLK